MKEAGKNKVLIVDDEKANIITMTHILSPEYAVYAAKNGEDAIEIATESLPDVILLDVLMAGIDGYDVIAALKKNEAVTKDIPVIFVTGLSDRGDEEKGFALGAADYITKPFSPAVVSARVRNQMKILKLQRALEQSNICCTCGGSNNLHGMGGKSAVPHNR